MYIEGILPSGRLVEFPLDINYRIDTVDKHGSPDATAGNEDGPEVLESAISRLVGLGDVSSLSEEGSVAFCVSDDRGAPRLVPKRIVLHILGGLSVASKIGPEGNPELLPWQVSLGETVAYAVGLCIGMQFQNGRLGITSSEELILRHEDIFLRLFQGGDDSVDLGDHGSSPDRVAVDQRGFPLSLLYDILAVVSFAFEREDLVVMAGRCYEDLLGLLPKADENV